MAKGYNSKRRTVAKKKSHKVKNSRKIYFGSKSDVKAYKQQRARIKRHIKSMRERGYEVPEDILPPIPKRITKSSVNRLKRITSSVIYGKSSYTTDTKTGEAVTGTLRRYEELKEIRSKAAKKGRITRAIRKRQKEGYSDVYIDGYYYEFGEESSDVPSIETPTEPYYPSEGELLFQNLEDVLARYQDGAPRETGVIRKALYSRSHDEVVQALQEKLQLVDRDAIELEVEYEYHHGIAKMLEVNKLYSIVLGHALSAKEMSEISDAREEDEDEEDFFTDYDD